MKADKKDILIQLKREILPLGGLKSIRAGSDSDLGLGPVNDAFPQRHFPLGAVHEFINREPESASASVGFIAGLVAGLMKQGGAVIWISCSKNIFPPALKMFGIEPSRIIFIQLQNEKDLLWSMEEALKCSGLAAVVGELSEMSFTTSRRFQLAVEQSRVTGFVLRSNPHNLNSNALVSRWRIQSLPSEFYDELPGIGFPRWSVELLKIRNGKPGNWQFDWAEESFRYVFETIPSFIPALKRKTG
jgi:protein ImuA